MKELVRIGAVRVEHRYDGAQRLTNAYHVRTSRPGRIERPMSGEGLVPGTVAQVASSMACLTGSMVAFLENGEPQLPDSG
jgi:hypothetical protein